MIIDLGRFLERERPYWEELETLVARLEGRTASPLDVKTARRFHYLYRRASADLAQVMTFAADPGVRGYLERLVARAYAEVHETRRRGVRLRPLRWLLHTLPCTFRRRFRPFVLAVIITCAGAGFGGGAVALDPEAKSVLMPFAHLQMHPAERVRREETSTADSLAGMRSAFAAQLMTHNIRVSLLTLALGMTWGVGTLTMLFYNGVILGAVAADFLLAGQGVFLAGWLLPHGSIEIPAILVAGQAGLVFAGALLGRDDPAPLGDRLRRIGPDVVTLVGGLACMLVWAGVVESFLSQYHEPMLPYWLKITFGALQFVGLAGFLATAGRDGPGDGRGEDRAG